jgi:hypothetical protein
VEVQGRDDMDVRTSHASILGPSIHERAESGRGVMFGKVILNKMGIDAMVEGSVNLDKVFIRNTAISSMSRRNVGGPIGRKDLANQVIGPIS